MDLYDHRGDLLETHPPLVVKHYLKHINGPCALDSEMTKVEEERKDYNNMPFRELRILATQRGFKIDEKKKTDLVRLLKDQDAIKVVKEEKSTAIEISDYEDTPYNELIKLAKRRGIRLKFGVTKLEIIKALKENDAKDTK